jgi:hypothetical protein
MLYIGDEYPAFQIIALSLQSIHSIHSAAHQITTALFVIFNKKKALGAFLD